MENIVNINPSEQIEKITKWIRDWFEENGKTASAVIGLSGGKDSTIVAALLVKALGKDRVVGVMMPNGEQKDIADSQKVAELLDIKTYTVNIAPAVDGEKKALEEAGVTISNDAQINTPPRIRIASPCSAFLVTEMRMIGDALGLPKDLIHKTPSDGLCGLSDEDKLGFTYDTLDRFILTGVCEDETLKAKIDRLHNINLHKLKTIPMYKK